MRPGDRGADDFDGFVLDEAFVQGGVAEPSAEERIATARRIARGNDRLHAQGEISDGSGKPVFQRTRRRTAVIWIAAILSVSIVALTVFAVA